MGFLQHIPAVGIYGIEADVEFINILKNEYLLVIA